MNRLVYFLPFLFLTFTACDLEPQLNINEAGKDKFEAMAIDRLPSGLAVFDTVYVSIYSDIYSESKATRFNLTATLSLRNTSFRDTIYISDVDYYDSAGDRLRQYLEQPIVLLPMQSMEYVIEEGDTAGGTGANFIVTWAAADSLVHRPVFEGIMISTNGQQGISFSTTGVSISQPRD